MMAAMSKIRIAIAGVGNCASSLVQGIHYYAQQEDTIGLMHEDIGGWRAQDIDVVAAFDIDARKVGRPLEQAIFALPNNTKQFYPNVPETGVTVQMGNILDGIAPHMADYPANLRFEPAKTPSVDVAKSLADSGAEILVNYLPVGSELATQFYAEACLKAGVSLINCIPVFIAREDYWNKRFKKAGLPVIGDDIKSQVGATIVQ